MRGFAFFTVVFLLLSGFQPPPPGPGWDVLFGGCVWLAKQAVEAEEEAEAEREKELERKKQQASLRAKAIQGDAEAQYLFGAGNRDAEERFRWICLAANQGFARAQNYLGGIYARGQAPLASPNLTVAYLWYSLAAANGFPTGEWYLETTADEMTAAETAEAKRLIEMWKPDPKSCDIETVRTAG